MPGFHQLHYPVRRQFSALLLLGLLLAGTLVACNQLRVDYCTIAPANVDPQLLIQNGSVYLQAAGANSLYAISSENGAVLWKYHVLLNEYEGGMSTARLVANGVLYMKVEQRGLYALRASDGALLWQQPKLPADFQLTAVIGGAVYGYSKETMNLDALQASDGSFLWEDKLASVPTSIQVSGGLLYLSIPLSSQTSVIALQASDGSQVWQFQAGLTADQYPVSNTILAAEGMVFADLDKLYALRASDGQPLWSQSFQPIIGNWVEDQGTLYAPIINSSTFDHQVVALRVSDGSLLWRIPASHASGLLHRLLIDNGILYLSDALNGTAPSNLYVATAITALRASDGSTLWTHPLGRNGFSVYLDNTVMYLLSPTGLDALRASDGILLWHHPTAAASVRVAADGVYLGTGGVADGSPCHKQGPSSLEKLRASDGASLWHVEEAAVSKPSL